MGLSGTAQFSLWDTDFDTVSEPGATPAPAPVTAARRGGGQRPAAPDHAAAQPSSIQASHGHEGTAAVSPRAAASPASPETARENPPATTRAAAGQRGGGRRKPTGAKTPAAEPDSAPDPARSLAGTAARAATPPPCGTTPRAGRRRAARQEVEIDSCTTELEDLAPIVRATPPAPGDGIEPSLPGHVAVPMPARIDEWERRLLADPELLGDIGFAVGGPFHVLYPERVRRNIEAFRAVFDEAGVDGAIFYGKKANKAACVARACAEQGAGVDVASVGELSSALAQGVRGSDLMVTGPVKSAELLWLAARHGALIALDSPEELDRLAALDIPVRVLLRVRPPKSASRFGMTDAELAHVLTAAELRAVRLTGFSFHLSGYDPIPRAELAAELIERCVRARDLGHPAGTISLGGGFGVDYLSAESWLAFTAGAGPQWFHDGKRFDSYYPYHCESPGAAMLAALLNHGELAKRLRDNEIRVAIEPGRALLDRAGSTVFHVQGVKIRIAQDHPYQLLTVDGTSLSLSEQWFASEYLPDPVPWPTRPGPVTAACVGAATCLESDMLSWRRIPLPRPVAAGDLLVYPNTAGYQMDSNESAFHELPIPPKVVLQETPTGRFRWAFDAG